MTSQLQKTNIYILKLTGGNYYIGKAANVYDRYAEHCAGTGSAWTALYKPLSVEKVIESADSFDEDKWTKRYMAAKGIDRVRGGSYSSIRLDPVQLEALNRELKGAADKCFNCGSVGHFVVDCRKTGRSIPQPTSTISSKCFRCGRGGHLVADCYAKTNVHGYYFDDSSDDSDESYDSWN